MPAIEFLEPSAIPASSHQPDPNLLIDARENLIAAGRAKKAIMLTLDPDERPERLINAYRRMAKTFHISLVITRAGHRPYTNGNGRTEREAGVLYIRLMKIAGRPPKDATEAGALANGADA